jgi:replication-associated recombination protein RarA
MPQTQPLVEKYRPTRIEDFVLPSRHCLHKVLQWIEDPYPSAWLFHGPSGVGKTSLAIIMAALASPCEHGRQVYLGPDLDASRVRQLAPSLVHRPVWGGMHAIRIDEADSIPEIGQVRLLGLLENKGHALVIATSNQDLEKYESRLTSRFYPVHFSVEGLLKPGTDWLLGIAEKEEISINRKAAERMVVESKSNLRAALQRLDAYWARQLFPDQGRKCHGNPVPSPLPVVKGVVPPGVNRVGTVVEPASIC